MEKWGGPWTQIKLDILSKYLRFYTTALKNQHWCDRIYIDAFAGSGKCEIRSGKTTKTIDGSAKIALENDPQFQRFIFIEADNKRHNELKHLCNQYTDKNIEIYESDANQKIQEFCKKTNWKKNRSVLFLDPYGMEADWETVEAIAKTKSIDFWYLFPLMGFYRNLPINKDSQDERMEKNLFRILGTNEWKNFYTEPQTYNLDLFDESNKPSAERESGWEHLVPFTKLRLESVFPAVSDPLLLPQIGPPQFALFFAVSNDSEKAIKPGMRAANYILRNVE